MVSSYGARRVWEYPSATNKKLKRIDISLHVLFSGTFVIAIRTVERFETFVNRVLMGDEISAIRKTFVAFLTSPGPEFFVNHFDVFYHIWLFVKSVSAHITYEGLFLAVIKNRKHYDMHKLDFKYLPKSFLYPKNSFQFWLILISYDFVCLRQN